MNKNRIRLSESQLHRVIKESVNRVLNEIKFGGESLHGDNPEDWEAMHTLRDYRINRESELGMYNNDIKPWYNQVRHRDRDDAKAIDLTGRMHPNDFHDGWRNAVKNGVDKGNRMARNLGYIDY